MRNSLQILFAASLASVAVAPASAQMKPSSPEAIASAATECWSVTSAESVDEAGLRKLGWTAGSFRSPDGKAIENPLRMYSKRGSYVLLMIIDTPAMKGCAITSRVAKPTDIGATAQLLFTKLKAIDPAVVGGKGSGNGQIVYLSLPRVAELSATGTKEQPATRIVVGAPRVEKK